MKLTLLEAARRRSTVFAAPQCPINLHATASFHMTVWCSRCAGRISGPVSNACRTTFRLLRQAFKVGLQSPAGFAGDVPGPVIHKPCDEPFRKRLPLRVLGPHRPGRVSLGGGAGKQPCCHTSTAPEHGGFHGKQCAPHGQGTQNGWPDDMLERRLISAWARPAGACKMRARDRSAASLCGRGTPPKATRDFTGNSAPRVGLHECI